MASLFQESQSKEWEGRRVRDDTACHKCGERLIDVADFENKR
jgi:hypothetical protein